MIAKLLNLIRRLPGGGVRLSWTWDIGPDGKLKNGGWPLPTFRLPGSRAAKDSHAPPSLSAHDFGPQLVAEARGTTEAKQPAEKAMEFPSIYPLATQTHLNALKSVADLKPVGITVHYTADRNLDRTLRALTARDLGYHAIIDRDGTVYQCVPFNRAVWHAGKALWGPHSPNRAHISVSLLSWGELEELAPGAYQSWNGVAVPTGEVIKRRDAHWDAATPAQEKGLFELLVWACGQGIDVANLCGHDECALPKGRKIDPGGVLSMTMEELRAAVRSRIAPAV